MIATTPIEIDGQIYDRYNLALSINGLWKPIPGTEPLQHFFDGQVAMRLIPARVLEDGTIEARPEHGKSIALGSTATADIVTQQHVIAIRETLQSFVDAKGL